MGIKWVFYLSVDEDGYYIGEKQIGVGEGLFLADDVVETPLPEGINLTKSFARWTGEEWIEEAKPTTAAECAALGPVSHQSTTARCNELRKLYEELTKGSEDYRLERGENLEWIVVEIPSEEKESQEAESALSDFDGKLSSLKERMSLAMLQGNQEQVTALQGEYQKLMSEGV